MSTSTARPVDADNGPPPFLAGKLQRARHPPTAGMPARLAAGDSNNAVLPWDPTPSRYQDKTVVVRRHALVCHASRTTERAST